MVTSKKILAIIPARGGSKSIPNKNIKLLNGIPLLAYSIAAGLQSQSVNRVIVSTDDKKIAEIARSFGAEVPFLRPKKYAQDNSTDFPVFKHCLDWLKQHEEYVPDIIVHLRPTSPLRPPTLVDQAIELLIKHSSVDSVRAIVPSGQNPYKMWRLNTKGYITPLLTLSGVPEPFNAPRQQLPATYWQTGHIDVIHYRTIAQKKTLSGNHIVPVKLDPRYSIDIDTEADWNRAEWLLNNLDLPIIKP